MFFLLYISFVYLFRINKIPADKMRSPLAAQICHFFSAEARFEELSLWCLTQHKYIFFECQPGDALSINSAKQGEVCDEELVKLSRFAFLKLKLFHASWACRYGSILMGIQRFLKDVLVKDKD